MVFEVISSSLPSCKVANTSGREVDGREREKGGGKVDGRGEGRERRDRRGEEERG